ncbi:MULTISPECIES: helix-turn-helix domain-containing protein [unclassified Frankia]|uniref:helix-turn-helix domain-containing protein n=1 Tax=unclassified Frankia TaxID=2632575 RepID=UPI002AD31AF7|nr:MULTISPECIES: helix-turn-helix domain-containing protein [unclassified Frankia]
MGSSGVVVGAERIESIHGDRETVTAAQAAVAAAVGAEVVLKLPDGTYVPLPPALTRLVAASLRELAAGHAVTMLPSEALLSPAEAGELLGLSRPFVSRLLDAGEIPSERLPESRHRRVRLSDVLAFQQQRESRRAGRRIIAEAADAAGIPY